MQRRGEKASRRDSRSVLPVLFVLTAALGLAIALFGGGSHYGLHNDDYFHKLWAYDLAAQTWHPTLELDFPYFRPLGQIVVANLASGLPGTELPLHLLWAAVHLANVSLAALLAYRLVRSPLAAVIVGGLMLFPFQAHEAVLWHSGAAGAALGTLITLAAVHLLLLAIERETGWGWPALAGLALVVIIPQFYEQAVVVIFCLPLFALFRQPLARKRMRRALLLILLAAGLLLAYWFLVMRHSTAVDTRGGLQPSLYALVTEGIPRLYHGLVWSLFERYELNGFAAAWYLGKLSLSKRLVVPALLALAGVAATAALVLASEREGEHPPGARGYLALAGVGCLWFGAAFLPLLVVEGHVVDSRILYLPWVGLAFVLAAAMALVVTPLPVRIRNVVLMLAGLFFLLQVVEMAGFGQVYRLRAWYDEEQLSALVRAAPHLPAGEIYAVPLDTEERSVSTAVPGYDALDWWLPGVLENHWSAASALALRYARQDIVAVTSTRWDRLTVDGVEWQGNRAYLLIRGEAIPADRCLVFTYRQGEVILYDAALIERAGGSQERIPLPLAREAAAEQAHFDYIVIDQADHG